MMKKQLTRMAIGAIPLMLATAAHAIAISGSIQFVGTATMNAGQTAFISYTGPGGIGSSPIVLAGSETGSYGAVPDGTSAIWSGFTFNPPAASVTPLWMMSVGSTVYSFDATSMVVTHPNGTTLNIEGTGIAHITGFEDTLGTWTVTATGSGLTFTFGASTDSGPGTVPDGGTTVLLLGSALCGLALLRKRLA